MLPSKCCHSEIHWRQDFFNFSLEPKEILAKINGTAKPKIPCFTLRETSKVNLIQVDFDQRHAVHQVLKIHRHDQIEKKFLTMQYFEYLCKTNREATFQKQVLHYHVWMPGNTRI